MSKPVLAIAVVVLLMTTLGVSASGASYYRYTPQDVVEAALRSPAVRGGDAVLFRHTPGQQRCRLRGGGPAPGSVAIGTCWTDVWFHADGSATVRLMISPPYTRTDVGQTWVFHVGRSLHTTLVKPPTNDGIGGEA